MSTRHLIEHCKAGDRKAQQMLYSKLSAPMMGVCLRYLKNREDAEEVFLNGFFNAFQALKSFEYRDDPSFFGWVKRIMVNECLMWLRKQKEIWSIAIIEDHDPGVDLTPLEKLAAKDLLKLIQQIPVGYRTVFNLYAIEGYSHKEISELLKISEGTSKSQLFKAKKLLQTIIKEEANEYGT